LVMPPRRIPLPLGRSDGTSPQVGHELAGVGEPGEVMNRIRRAIGSPP
jgi:hypothetical protein